MAFEFTLPDLPYAHDALQPHMSAETLEYHHDKHHAAYVTNANKLLAGSGLEDKDEITIIKESFGANPGLFNNAAQVFNHTFFFNGLTPDGGGAKMPGNLEAAINDAFGGFDKFREEFINAGITQFGSGWAWLALKDGKLQIMKTPNAENPYVHGATPIIACDVWEHAYYIDYRNLRPKFLEVFVDHLANWEFAAANLEAGG
ncbi:MAG TPA: superoxide dismutase [Thermopetrobacter sp.]|nr:superoxide dismutase [Thermopetrobacter sp.]